MFASTDRGFMGPLRGRGDKYYEDVYGKRNDEDPAGDACESESDSDGAVAGVFNKQRTIDSYGRIKKRKGMAELPKRRIVREATDLDRP